jgi:hypothetical protein
VPDLGSAQADAEQLIAPGCERSEHGERVVLVALALDTGDDAAGDALARASIGKGCEIGSITTSTAMPRCKCACGLMNTSAWRTFWLAARAR